MAEEKVLHEVKIIETEDGFRIEIKGDKERIKEFLKHRGPGMGFGPMGAGFRHRGHHRHGHGPFGHFARMWGAGPWDWDEESDEPPQERGPQPPRY